MKFFSETFFAKKVGQICFSLEKERCDRIFLFVIFLEIHPKKIPYNDDPVFFFLGAILLCCHTGGPLTRIFSHVLAIDQL
jgi:hypothetical protein